MNVEVYFVLGKFTAEGIKNIKDSPKRLEAANKLSESLGGKILKFYYTMGRYNGSHWSRLQAMNP